ncbi:unnamed protein product [Cladocopium goreaui]|uniref:Uncharacterized protein n=1 Tax=Cladocopium goreaui TaxID=2562237 RepID=A0A9P1DUP8_9DINO|nr:unnamed protein product [Cladocopium goreaui]
MFWNFSRFIFTRLPVIFLALGHQQFLCLTPAKIYFDGSSVGRSPIELFHLWSPQLEKGFFGPPLVKKSTHWGSLQETSVFRWGGPMAPKRKKIDSFTNDEWKAWLNSADPEFLGPSQTQNLSRQDLALLVAFSFGWPPYAEVPKNATTHVALLKESKKEYANRGKPAQHTKWDPCEIIRYMKWKAPYPTKDVAKIPDKFPSTGYELTFQASSIRPWVLQHPDYQFAFQMLPDEYILYQDERGEDVIIGNKLGPIYCADLLRLEASGFRVRKAEALVREGRRGQPDSDNNTNLDEVDVLVPEGKINTLTPCKTCCGTESVTGKIEDKARDRVMIRALNHILFSMTSHTFDKWCPSLPLTLDSVWEAKVDVNVVDEESSQNKGLNFLAEVAHIRMVSQPDFAHQKWNAFKRTMRWAGLNVALMKLTILCA